MTTSATANPATPEFTSGPAPQAPGSRRAWLGLGANLGDPPAQLRAALREIAALPGIRVLASSGFYRSAAIGPPGQPDYCNAVCAIETVLPPPALLTSLQAIETAAGRVRGERWGPRVLDLDILHVEGLCMDTPALRLPHPQLALRNFVLVPLAELAPELVIPGLGVIADLAARVEGGELEPWR